MDKRCRRSDRPATRPAFGSLANRSLHRTVRTISTAGVRQEIRSGTATNETKLAVCEGAVSLGPPERVEALAILASDANTAIQQRAANTLLALPIATVLAALAIPDAAPQLFGFCAAHWGDRPRVADAMAMNAACPLDLLRVVARQLSTSAVQHLLDNLDPLSSAPGLMAALVASSSLTAEQRAELQDLLKETPEPESAFVEAAAEAVPDPAKRLTLLQRLAKMRVVERVQLALKGGREERILLIKDPCKVVQRAVLQSPRITDQEIESFAGMTILSEEVLRMIATSRVHRKNYNVVHNVMFNPKAPLDVTLHMLTMVTPMDLKVLSKSRNIPETLRTAASRLHLQRTMKKSVLEE
jgi:hypothetical protein